MGLYHDIGGGLVGVNDQVLGGVSNPSRPTGSYIGAKPTSGRSGIWLPEAVRRRKAAGRWQDSVLIWPAAYQALHDSFAAANRRYVDPVHGSNSNSGTDELAAWATINHAVDTSASGTAIILLPGTHTAAQWTTVDYVLYAPSGKTLTFIGVPGQTIVQGTNTSNRDSHFAGMWSGSAAYGLILRRNVGGRASNYMFAMWGSNGNYNGTFYNCVLQETSAGSKISHNYDNGGSGVGRTRNSLVIAANWEASYSGGASNVTTDCAFTGTANLTGSASGNANGVTYNATTYALTANNTIRGVYSGTYAWPTI